MASLLEELWPICAMMRHDLVMSLPPGSGWEEQIDWKIPVWSPEEASLSGAAVSVDIRMLAGRFADPAHHRRSALEADD